MIYRPRSFEANRRIMAVQRFSAETDAEAWPSLAPWSAKPRRLRASIYGKASAGSTARHPPVKKSPAGEEIYRQQSSVMRMRAACGIAKRVETK